VLLAEDGSLIAVKAAAQPVMVVRHCPAHGSPHDLLRAAYHLGNRHVQLELQSDRLLLEPDHVLADMLKHMHLLVSDELAPSSLKRARMPVVVITVTTTLRMPATITGVTRVTRVTTMTMTMTMATPTTIDAARSRPRAEALTQCPGRVDAAGIAGPAGGRLQL